MEFKSFVFGQASIDLTFKLINDRLFISTTFIDIQNNQFVGRMEYNHWESKNSISHFHDEDDNMEIIDANGYVMFNMRYEFPNTVIVQGYSIFKDHICVVSNSGITFFKLKSRQSAIDVIKKINPLNFYPIPK